MVGGADERTEKNKKAESQIRTQKVNIWNTSCAFVFSSLLILWLSLCALRLSPLCFTISSAQNKNSTAPPSSVDEGAASATKAAGSGKKGSVVVEKDRSRANDETNSEALTSLPSVTTIPPLRKSKRREIDDTPKTRSKRHQTRMLVAHANECKVSRCLHQCFLPNVFLIKLTIYLLFPFVSVIWYNELGGKRVPGKYMPSSVLLTERRLN